MKFIRIEDIWVNELSKDDDQVKDNKNESRPYIFIPIMINKIPYAIPLSSIKINRDYIDRIAIIDSKNNYGTLLLSKMIPIPQNHIIMIDFKKENPKYKDLLKKQLKFVKSNIIEIEKKCNEIYKKKILSYNNHNIRKLPFISICVDYKAAEQKYFKVK